MQPFAQLRDVQTACICAVLQVGAAAEAGRLLMALLTALLLCRCLLLLRALQALFSFIHSSLEMHIAMS